MSALPVPLNFSQSPLAQDFIVAELSILAWAASVQRANLYRRSRSVVLVETPAFRLSILRFVFDTLVPRYQNGCTSEEHLAVLEELVAYGSEVGERVLGLHGYKIGVAQKLLNMLLKYLWRLGYIPAPPHCPVDRIVLSKTSLRNQLNWTEMTTVSQYRMAIAAIEVCALKAGLSIAQWELREFRRR